jgi:hypothetical protein
MTQQAVTGLVPERLRMAGDHSHRASPGPGRREEPFRAGRAGAGRHRPPPVPRQPAKPDGTPRWPCDTNPLAGFGSEASEDQHHVLNTAHTTKGMTAQ